jgi:hypothetical protein
MIPFHRLLIGTAILFFAGFAVWAVLWFRTNGSAAVLALGIASGVVAAAFAYYLKNLRRFLGR